MEWPDYVIAGGGWFLAGWLWMDLRRIKRRLRKGMNLNAAVRRD